MCRRLASLLILLLLTGSVAFAQEEPQAPGPAEGGRFVWNGNTIEVPAATISRYVQLYARLNPGDSARGHLLLAWQRAIRLEIARIDGVVIEDADLDRFFTEQMAELHRLCTVDGKFSQERFMTFLTAKGFADMEAWNTFVREELLCEKIIEREFPRREPTETELRRRHELLNTTISVDAFTIAVETLTERPTFDRGEPETMKSYEQWFALLPEHYRKLYDDRDRPAIEMEAIYVVFRGKSPEDIRAWFEAPRGELGTSIAERTRDIVPTKIEFTKCFGRWQTFRRTHYTAVEASLPPRLTDEESFEKLVPYFTMECKILKYLEAVWRDLRARPIPVDMPAEARKLGLDYRHLPFAQTGVHWNDPILNGDHPTHMLRIPPGSIFDYVTMASDPGSIHLAEGVVDQPGLHASIFRMIRAEEMRVLDAAAAIERAWPDFESAAGWIFAERAGRAFTEAWGARMQAWNRERPSPDDVAARRATFEDLARDVKDARRIGPFVLTPFRDAQPKEIREGDLPRRVQNVLARRWTSYGMVGLEVKKGDVLPAIFDDARRLVCVPIVVGVHPPAPTLYDRDAESRRLAKLSLVSEWNAERVQQAKYAWAWPTIAKRVSLVAPQLDRVMTEDIKRSLPQSKPADR